VVYPGEDTLTIYTDGSSYSHPRRGGFGFRFVWTGDDGHEVHHDSDLAGYREATNNQMELMAAIVALGEVLAPWSPVPLAEFRKIEILSDSDYLVSNYRSALYRWPGERWMTSAGHPVENADLWQDLVKAAQRTGK
jgi:ribonuclease HI